MALTLKNDALYNILTVKFPVEIKRKKDGKKEVKFYNKWQGITKNVCSGNETNIAFRTGINNDITVLDFDDEESVAWFILNVGEINSFKCHHVKTHQGIHLYFKYSKELDLLLASNSINKVKVIKAIDIRSEGNCIFYGKGYELIKFEKEIEDVPILFIEKLKDHLKKEPVKFKPYIINKIDYQSNNDDVIDILNGLSSHRYTNYDDWIKVAFCLKNSFKDTYKEDWINWSKNSDEHIFDREVVEKYWDNIKPPQKNCITVNSLYDMLKTDNIEAFDFLMKRKKNIIEENTKFFVFNDYKDYLNQITTVTEVENFLKNTVRRITNKGVPSYALKIIDENKNIRWNIVKQFPLGLPDSFKFEDKEGKIIKTSFSAILKFQVEQYIMKDNVVFEPRGPHIDYDPNMDSNINLFPDWKIKYHKGFVVNYDLLEPIFHHQKKVYCDDQDDLYVYLNGYLASIIQNPEKKLLVALCFVSLHQGAGKNIFWDWFGKYILGILYQYVNNIDTIFNKFSKRFENCLLVILDEISSGGNAYVLNNQLKSIITQTVQSIEPKGMEAYLLNDYRNYIFLSNNKHIVKVENTDRRFCMFECNNCYVGNHEYFKNLNQCLMNPEVQIHYFHYLIQYDLSNFQVRNFPNTKLRQEVMELSVPNHIRFLEYFAEKQQIQECLKASTLYESYKDFIKEREGGHGLLTQTKFSIELKSIFKSKRSNGTKYIVSKEIVVKYLRDYYKNPEFGINNEQDTTEPESGYVSDDSLTF
jgi:hypothetical protein